MELISHKNSSKGRSQKQRTGLGGKKWKRSGLLPHLTSEPHSASMPAASSLARGVEYPIQMFLSNSAGPLINAAHDFLAIHFHGAGGDRQTLTLFSVQHAAFYQHSLHLSYSFNRHRAWAPCEWAVGKTISQQKSSK